MPVPWPTRSLCGERFEEKLNKCGGNLERAAVSLAQDWRSDNVMRKLESMLIVADQDAMLVLSGNGEVDRPGRRRGRHRLRWQLRTGRPPPARWCRTPICPPRDIAVKALTIAASICVFTNDHISVETIEG